MIEEDTRTIEYGLIKESFICLVPMPHIEERDPTEDDLSWKDDIGKTHRFEIATQWINKKTHSVFILKFIRDKKANWDLFTVDKEGKISLP